MIEIENKKILVSIPRIMILATICYLLTLLVMGPEFMVRFALWAIKFPLWLSFLSGIVWGSILLIKKNRKDEKIEWKKILLLVSKPFRIFLLITIIFICFDVALLFQFAVSNNWGKPDSEQVQNNRLHEDT